MKKVLNLYSGIGGNRKLWQDVNVTAIEIEPKIAEIYQDFFPNDTVIVTDAHKYLLEHYNDGWDFIWSSPPCPTHSRFNHLTNVVEIKKVKYPDMTLYQEIIYLQNWFDGKYCVENVVSYYDPLIKPQQIGRHYFWANFHIPMKNFNIEKVRGDRGNCKLKEIIEAHGLPNIEIDVPNIDNRTVVKNCVNFELGLHILDSAFKYKQKRIGDTNGY